MKKFLNKIYNWLRESRHLIHLVSEIIIAYIGGPLLGIVAGLLIEQQQGWKGDWLQDLLADFFGIVIGSLLQLLVIGLFGWQAWFITLFIISMMAMSGIVKFVPSYKQYRKTIGFCGFILGLISYIGIIWCS